MARCSFCDYENRPGAGRCEGCGAELPGAHEAERNLIDEEMLALIARGEKIEAIKLVRERTGCSLRDAKEAVEAMEQGRVPSLPVRPASSALPLDVEQQIVELLRERRTIDAVKVYRDCTGSGLKEAKKAVDELARDFGISSGGAGCAGVLALLLLAAAGVLRWIW